MKSPVGYAKIIGIVGPTGSGKSSLALSAAHTHRIEILNGDSLQVYQRVDIGTAKPTPQERSRCPHHLFDIVAPPHTWTAGDFRKTALEIIQRGDSKTTLLIVGGSGFYLQALASGMFEAPALPEPARTELRKSFEHLTSEQVHFLLSEKDPLSAQRIHPQDRYRILRALEVLTVTGKPLSEIHAAFQKQDLGLPIQWIGLARPREHQEAALRMRIEQMFQDGWLKEVQTLIQEGLQDWSPLQSVGYKEILDCLNTTPKYLTSAALGASDLSKLQDLITIRHMQLSKKQMTWFRRLPAEKTTWFDAGTERKLAETHLSNLIGESAPLT